MSEVIDISPEVIDISPGNLVSSPACLMMHSAYKLNKMVTIYSLDVLLSQFGSSPLFHAQFLLLPLNLHTDFSGGQVVWYSHLLKNFPQFVVIYTVKGFSIVNEAEVNVFLEFPCFSYDPVIL